MSKPLPEKGTAEYYEMLSDDPADFIDDGPEEGNAAAKAAVKLGPCDHAHSNRQYQTMVTGERVRNTDEFSKSEPLVNELFRPNVWP